MTTVRTFQRGLGSLLGYPEGQVDQRTRPLREKGLLSSGPRGLAAANITTVEAAMVLCCLAPLRANDASTIGLTICNLEFVPIPGELEELFKLPNGRRASFGAVVGLLLSDPSALNWDRIEIAANGSMAVIFAGARRLMFVLDRRAAEVEIAGDRARYDRKAEADCGHIFKLTFAMVAFLGSWLSEDPPEAIRRLDMWEGAISLGHRPLKDVPQLLAELSGSPRKLDA